ncbi:hypothetical protein BC830DRAFT_1224323, partial [Chytriomyces sp. MP71]
QPQRNKKKRSSKQSTSCSNHHHARASLYQRLHASPHDHDPGLPAFLRAAAATGLAPEPVCHERAASHDAAVRCPLWRVPGGVQRVTFASLTESIFWSLLSFFPFVYCCLYPFTVFVVQ